MIEKGVDPVLYSKPFLRSVCEKERSSLSPKRREEAAQNLLLSLTAKLKAYRFVISFVPFRGEIATTPLNLMLAQTRKLVLPRIERGELTFHLVDNLNSLKANRWGIFEPDPLLCPFVSNLSFVSYQSDSDEFTEEILEFSDEVNGQRLFARGKSPRGASKLSEKEGVKPNTQLSIEEVDVVLVPGLAFDSNFHRLGYGGGYYDRVLKMHPHLYSIGIGFEEQLLQENLPVDPWDLPLQSLHLV